MNRSIEPPQSNNANGVRCGLPDGPRRHPLARGLAMSPAGSQAWDDAKAPALMCFSPDADRLALSIASRPDRFQMRSTKIEAAAASTGRVSVAAGAVSVCVANGSSAISGSDTLLHCTLLHLPMGFRTDRPTNQPTHTPKPHRQPGTTDERCRSSCRRWCGRAARCWPTPGSRRF